MAANVAEGLAEDAGDLLHGVALDEMEAEDAPLDVGESLVNPAQGVVAEGGLDGVLVEGA